MTTKLHAVVTPDQPGAKPPRKLGQHGAVLWKAVMAEYSIVDAGGVEMLTAACQSLDRAESLREQIDCDGEIVRGKTGPREHPGLRHELAARAFTCRTLQRLGLDVEAVRSVGRPPTTGWTG